MESESVIGKSHSHNGWKGNRKIGIPVTRKELWAFYIFGFATEPYYATAMAVAIPIIIETLAANAGYQDDLVTKCDTSKAYSCKVKFGGTWIDTSSFVLYTTAISVAIQALVFISLSAIADYGNWRKLLLLSTSAISAIFTILFMVIVRDDLYWLGALFCVLSNVSFGASYVFYYAYVPTLTANSVQVLQAIEDAGGKEGCERDETVTAVREKVGNEISGKGFAFGYLGAVINLAISAGLVLATSGLGPTSTYPLQIACGFAGLWNLVFIVFTYKWMINRPGPTLPQGENYLLYSWKQVAFTLSRIKQLSQAFLFLLSWFIMSDAVATIVSIAVLFAKKELGFELTELLIAAIIIPLAAGIGCVFWNFFRSFFKLTTKTMILILTVLYVVLPVFGLIGLSDKLNFGLKNKAEVFAFAAYHGFLLGAIQSFYRVQFSEMLPPGKENEFFGLYEITDKGSSWIGPLVVGAITDSTGNIRYGFAFLVCSMIIPFFITLSVNPKKGILQAHNYEQEEKLANPLPDNLVPTSQIALNDLH